jgi:hypothetical protein
VKKRLETGTFKLARAAADAQATHVEIDWG